MSVAKKRCIFPKCLTISTTRGHSGRWSAWRRHQRPYNLPIDITSSSRGTKFYCWQLESALLTGGRYQLYHSTSSAWIKVIASYQSDVKGCSEHAPLLKVCHLQVYQTSEAQIFLLSPSTAAVRASFQSHLSHFFLSICQAEQTLILSSLSKETALSWRSGEGERWWAAYL